MIALKRAMYNPADDRGPTVGKDVQISKFGIGRYPNSPLPKPAGGYSTTFGEQMAEAVDYIQRKEGIERTRNIGKETWGIIWQHLDAYRRWQYRNWNLPLTWQEQTWEKLIGAMQMMSDLTPGYLLGGGHGVNLAEVSPRQRLDCSSSTSLGLFEAGMFEDRTIALVSGDFDEWGAPGVGQYFTVYYNFEHVWTRLHKSRWWRFDTSPHGEGGGGPRLRFWPRFTGGFAARHYPGM